MSDPVAALAGAVGILPAYTDQLRRVRETGPDTARALLGAMGLPVRNEADARAHLDRLADGARTMPRWHVSEPDRAPGLALSGSWEITFEDGTEQGGSGPLPALPLGRHRLESDGETCWMLVAPARLPSPPRRWGVTLPLYGLRTPERGGIGDYIDLAHWAEACAGAGAGFIGINPVHAGFPADPAAFSPYSPSHRRRLNTLHIACGVETASTGPLIDYPPEIATRRAALRAAYDRFLKDGDRAAFDAWRREEGAPLERFALHQALSDLHGPYWSSWPIALRDPDSAEVREAAQALAPEIAFHAWAQYEAERQLRAAGERARMAGAEYGLYLDLAVGTHPFGAETWDDRSAFAFGASLGAPPDAFSADGQAWGVAPFNPRTLIETGFAALAETLRRQMRFARLIRIDHILGFDRAFWVPEEPGLPGAYVKMPLDAMLAVVRMEAARAGAVVVGEDLGNIPDGLQAALDASGILGCRLIAFERDADAGFSFRLPEDYDAEALASFATHDLPTWAGWRKGFEIETRHALGLIDGETRAAIQAERARECAAFAAAGGGDTAAPDGMHAFLARTRSRLAAVQAEDILALEEQPNLPGTTTEYPNWRRRLPVCAAAFARNETLARAAAFMEEAGRGPHRQSETEQEPTWN